MRIAKYVIEGAAYNINAIFYSTIQHIRTIQIEVRVVFLLRHFVALIVNIYCYLINSLYWNFVCCCMKENLKGI